MTSLTSCLLWPFSAIWRLVVLVFELTGRILAIALGIVFLILGVLVSLTVIGAVVGIPMALFGLLLVIRGFF